MAVPSHILSQSKDVIPETHERNSKITMVACGDNTVSFNPSREAINLIGAFANNYGSSYVDSALNNGTRKFDASPELDLSLRRSESCFTSQRTEERHATLKHSDASAFSW